jgi:hypothetical protein
MNHNKPQFALSKPFQNFPKLLVFSLFLFFNLINIPSIGQNFRPPAKQWQMELNFGTNTNNPSLKTIDWTLGVIQTHDDHYVGVGFSSSDDIPDQQGITCTVNYNPFIYKVSSKGGTVIWNNVLTFGYPASGSSNFGRLIDICEAHEQDNKYYYTAIGHKEGTPQIGSSGDYALICKYNQDGTLAKDASGNDLVKFHRFSTGSSRCWGTSIRHFVYQGNDFYAITGEDNFRIFAAILDKDLNLVPNMLSTSGFVILGYDPHALLSPPINTEGRGYAIRVAYTGGTMPNGSHSGNAYALYVGGYIINGAALNYGNSGANLQSDGYLCKLAFPSSGTSNGTKSWEKIFASDNNISNPSHHLNQSPNCVKFDNQTNSYVEVRKNFRQPTPVDINLFNSSPDAISEDDHVFGFEETNDGSLIVTHRYHMTVCNCSIKNSSPLGAGDFHPVAYQKDKATQTNIQHTYLDFMKGDIYLSKIEASTGNVLSNGGLPQYVTHMSGDDFWTQVKQCYDKDASGNFNNFAVFGTSSNYYNEASSYDPYDESETQTPGDEDLILLKYHLNSSNIFERKWVKVFHGPGGGACGFGLAATRDGGFIVAGNNDEEADNHVLIKVANDCQARAYDEGNIDEALPNIQGQILSSNSNWSTNQFVTGSIIVPTGITLTINNNAKIQFLSYNNLYEEDGPNTPIIALNNTYKRIGIIVEPGGKLVVDNAILTNYEGCSTYGFEDAERLAAPWDGILINGNAGANMSSSGFASNFGIAEIKNNATLKNAVLGVTIGEDYGEGGILKATNANFLNNRKSIGFLPYEDSNLPNYNRSFIRGCNFINDAVITGWMNKGTNQHISAWGVRGIKISSITIKNQLLNSELCDEDRGIGLSTFDSDVDITRFYDVNGLGNMNEMEGLRTGVQSLNTGTSSPFYRVNVSGTNFLNVQEGIILENNVAPAITCNTFTFDNNLQPTSKYLLSAPFGTSNANYYGFGVYTTFTNAFNIVSNSFYFKNSNVLSFATITEQSGGGDLLTSQIKLNIISNSTATKAHFGMQAFGWNEGLEITCNKYINLIQDWYIDYNNINTTLSCAFKCFPNQTTANAVKLDPLNEFTISCTSSSSEHVNSNFPFDYHVKNSVNSPICYTGPTLVSVQNEVDCQYPCANQYINAPDGEFEGLNKTQKTSKSNLDYFGKIDSLWHIGRFDLIAQNLAKSNDPLNQLLAQKYDINKGTKYSSQSDLDNYLQIIVNEKLKQSNLSNLEPSTISELRNIAIGSSTESISSQNLISLNTNEFFYRKPFLPNYKSLQKTQKINTNEPLSSNILIFPNPFEKNLTVELKGKQNEAISNIEIVDILGKLVFQKTFSEEPFTAHLEVNGLLDGLYFIRVFSTKGIFYTDKIILTLK